MCVPHAQPSEDSSRKLPQAMLCVQTSHPRYPEYPSRRRPRCLCYVGWRRTHDHWNLLARTCRDQRLRVQFMQHPPRSLAGACGWRFCLSVCSTHETSNLTKSGLDERLKNTKKQKQDKKHKTSWVCEPHAQPSEDSSRQLPQAMLCVQTSHPRYLEYPSRRRPRCLC